MKPEDFDLLVARWLEGGASEEDQAALGAMLRESEEARLRFAELADQEAALRVLSQSMLQARQIREQVDAAENDSSHDRSGSSSSRRAAVRRRLGGPADSRSAYWTGALVAASVIFSLALLAALFQARPARRAPVERTAPAAADTALDRVSPEVPEEPRPRPPAAPDLSAKAEERREPFVRPPEDRPEPREEPRERIEEPRGKPPDPSPRGAPALPPPKAKPTQESRVGVAAVEALEGEVFLLTQEGRGPLRAGQEILAGDGVGTGGGTSRAALCYPDKTRLELGRETEARDFKAEGGKRLLVARGIAWADVKKQPQGQAMVIETPHGETRVLGTTLRIIVEGGSTRLEVIEGKVRLTRKIDGKSVEVPSGFAATAASGVDLAAARMIPDSPALALLQQRGEITINFGPEGLGVPAGTVNDWGEEFDPKRGYGWKGARGARDAPGTFWITDGAGGRTPFTAGLGRSMPPGYSYEIDPATGRPRPFRPDRGAGVDSGVLVRLGPLKASRMAVGWINHSETWVMPVPDGRYLLTVCVGDQGEQGPHHVAIEGRQLIDRVLTKAGEYHEPRDMPVEVKDGELTMVVAGYRAGRLSVDGSSDTILNYIVIKKAKAR